MEQQMRASNDSLEVSLSGQFTFSDNGKFRHIIETVKSGRSKSVTIDFSGVDFVDSAALGMLLLLRDLCQERQIDVALQSPQGQVQRIFAISRFDQLFSVR